MSVVYGYMRVSTKEQHEDRQRDALLAFGVEKGRLYCDKLSGKTFDRPRYQHLVHKRLKAGDVLVIKSIDRLGRDYNEVLEEWRYIVKVVGADMVVLDMPLLDTRVETSLVGTLISDIVLQLLSFVAQNERETTLQRQKEGIAAAKARGVRFGRPARPLPDTFEDAYLRWRNKKISISQALEITRLPRSSFYYEASKWQRMENASKNGP